MKIHAILFSLGCSSVAFAAPDATTLSVPDAQLVAHLHAVDQTEIDAGKLAETHGTAAGKTFGAMLVRDHSAFDSKLTAFAKKHGFTTIPNDTTITADEKKSDDDEMTKLKDLKGANFDKEIGTALALAHDQEIAKLDAMTIENKDLAAMVKTVKPTLKAHADAARKLANSEHNARK